MILLLALLTLFVSALNAQNWTTYKSKPAKFSIDFPAEAKEEKLEDEETVSYQYQSSLEDVIYMASAVIHETKLNVEGLTIEDLTNSSLEAFANVMGGEMKDSGDIKIGKNKGKYCILYNQEKGFMCYYRCIIVGQIQYQFIVINAPANDDKKTREKFFKSIAIKS